MTAPATTGGERPASRDQTFSKGGFGAGPPIERSKDFGGSVRRLARRLRPELRGGLAVFVLACLSVSLTALGIRVLGRATDVLIDGLRSNGGVHFENLSVVLCGVLVLFLGAGASAWLQGYVLAEAVQRTMFRLRSEVEDKLHRLPLSYIDGVPRGDLLSRVTNDMDNLAQSLQQTLSQSLTSLLTILGVAVMMLLISPILAMFALVLIPLSLLIARFVVARSRRRFAAQWEHTGMLNAQVEETFTGHALVKVFGRQRDAEQRFGEVNDLLYDASFRAQFVAGVMQPAMLFLGSLNFVAIAIVGGLRVLSGAMSIGDIQAFTQYSRQFTMPLQQLAGMMNLMQSGVASAERVFEFLDAPEQSQERADPVLITNPAGRVEFCNVSFAYDPSTPLIEDLCLLALPGQTVAIVGPTGAGKTTLVNLIMRFYEVDSGAILLDGVDITCLARSQLRSSVGMVLQDTWLFEGSIRDNIAYGKLDATDNEILTAARAAYVDRFVHSLPNGYDTVIDEDGGNLSSGEIQLITIARAFLSDPTILILDEATSSVDTRTEVQIQHAMAALRSRRTSFVIAHRLSTIRDADVILVMENGRLVEQGTHTELLARGGAYFALYDAQFRAPATEPPDPLPHRPMDVEEPRLSTLGMPGQTT